MALLGQKMLRKGNAQVRFIMVRGKAENDWHYGV